VPLNEHAIRQLRESATALDLYTWLAYRLPRISANRPASLTWQQLAVHFGNEGNNIRKFRQTVRDAWERQVSGVYPEARADFDTTMIRLHASPAPLQRTIVAGARLQAVPPTTDAKGTPPEDPANQLVEKFMTALRARLDPIEARVWLADSVLRQEDGAWQLVVQTGFKADWIRSRFSIALDQASVAVGLDSVPRVVARLR
jgi:hypothetical protein